MPAAVTAVAAAVVLGWGLGRPAFSGDESASVVATQRSWGRLLTLLHGADAPLVPYYAMLKSLTGLTTRVWPAAVDHPEVLYRWPSVAAAVIAGAVLVAWVARYSTLLLAYTTGATLLIIAGFSRYGQEARPYAMVMTAGVLATVVWVRLAGSPGRSSRSNWWVPVYALTVALIATFNFLALVMVAAHLVMALAVPEAGRRRRTAIATGLGAALGLLVVSPFLYFALTNAQGRVEETSASAVDVWNVITHLFTLERRPLLGLGAIMLLAVIGLVQLASAQYRTVAVVAAAWALTPIVILVPAMVSDPALLIGRYLIFVVPGWGLLAALGLVEVSGLVRRGLASSPAARPVAVATLLALFAGALATQTGSLQSVRTPDGHGDDIRPALAEADRGPLATLPIVVSARGGAIQIGAYRRGEEARLVNGQVQRKLDRVWPTMDQPRLFREHLQPHPRVLLLLRATFRAPCRPNADPPAVVVNRCMSPLLRKQHYQVVSAKSSGRYWTVAVLERPSATETVVPDP